MKMTYRDDIAKELILELVDNSYGDLSYEDIGEAFSMGMDQIVRVCKELEEEGLVWIK